MRSVFLLVVSAGVWAGAMLRPALGRVTVCAMIGGATLSPVLGGPAVEGWPGRRVILAEEIRQSAASRLSDLLFLFDEWTPMTVDGFTWQVSVRGLESYQTASWMIMVDGIRVDVDQFGTSALNRVPVHVSEIDSVEIVSLPQLTHGEFAEAGLIHIHTRRGGSGFEIRGTASTGNEAGDPGPYVYTEWATPNVDRIGPNYSVDGRFAGESVEVRGAGFRYRHYPTDAATRGRILRVASDAYPQMTVEAGSGALGGPFFGGRHRAFFASSRFDDFYFFKPYGREIPVVSRFTVGGATGCFPWGDRAGLEYRLARTEKRIGYRSNAPGLDFDWLTEKWTGGVEAFLSGSSLSQRYGAGFERVEAVSGDALKESGYELAKVYAGWEILGSSRASHRACAMVKFGEAGATVDAALAERWRISASHHLDVSAAYAERRPEHDGRIWYWTERGYEFLEKAGVAATSDGALGTARRWTIDAGWTATHGRHLSVQADGYYRDFSSLYLEDQRFQFDAEEQAFSAPIHLLSGQKGGVAGGEIVVEVRPSSTAKFRTFYRYESAVTGGEAFRNVWDAVPDHILRQTAAYRPVPSLTIWALLSYVSGSEWWGYRDADIQSGGAYRSKLDSFVTLDAAFGKWFWHRRLRGSVLLRDLLAQSPRYHPIGASFDTSLFVQVELIFGSDDDQP